MYKILYYKHLFSLMLFVFQTIVWAQTPSNLDYTKIYAHCLDGNVKAALPLLDIPISDLNKKDQQFKRNFEKRFKSAVDSSDYLKKKESKIHELQLIFRDYWRQYLLNPDLKHERSLGMNAIEYLKKYFPEVRDKKITRDSLGIFLSEYIKSKGYFTTASVNKTGGIYDLLIWQSQKDTTYSFRLKKEKIKTQVVFMNDFVTLGWEEYATFGKYYPGGWATEDTIYCVEGAYDITSEDFKISYLAHEGRHFLDNKMFRGLDNADLEYRSKLSELSLAKTTLYKLIDGFISNGNGQSENPHPLASYHVIKNLSEVLFDNDFEKDISEWKKINRKKINRKAYKLLKQNTRLFKNYGIKEPSIRTQ